MNVAGSSTREADGSPTSANNSSNQPHSPFYLRGNAPRANISTSSIASIIPPSTVLDKDKPESRGKHSFGMSSITTFVLFVHMQKSLHISLYVRQSSYFIVCKFLEE